MHHCMISDLDKDRDSCLLCDGTTIRKVLDITYSFDPANMNVLFTANAAVIVSRY